MSDLANLGISVQKKKEKTWQLEIKLKTKRQVGFNKCPLLAPNLQCELRTLGYIPWHILPRAFPCSRSDRRCNYRNGNF